MLATMPIFIFSIQTPTAVSISEIDNVPSVFENILYYMQMCSLIKTTVQRLENNSWTTGKLELF